MRWGTLVWMVLLLFGQPNAAAQDAPPEAEPAAKEEARQRFMRGVQLFEDGALDAALAEFRRSVQIHGTRVASRNVAVCLRALGRHDEALAVLEALAADDLSAEWKAMVARDVGDVKQRVGSIVVDVSVGGAVVLVSGRARGKSPLAGPIRVSSGSHRLRVLEPNHVPFETTLEVAGQQTVVVRAVLERLASSAELVVVERDGRVATVVVDQVQVGVTPWAGRLPTGSHTVFLTSAGELGTQPAELALRDGERRTLSLALEPLSSTLRIEPVPAGARMALDGVDLGSGVWEGRVRPANHRIEVAADGFLTATRDVATDDDAFTKLVVSLERDPTSERWQKKHPPRFLVELDAGLAIAPSLGGELADACGDGCSAAPALGARVVLRPGYQLGIGLGLYLDAGFLTLSQSLSERTGAVFAASNPSAQADAGTLDDDLLLQALIAGASVAFHRADSIGFHARLGVGALIGRVVDTRSGRFASPAGPYQVGPYIEDAAAHWIYVAPELRLSHRAVDPLQISVGLSTLIGINVTEPRWRDQRGVPSPTPLYGQFLGPGAPTALSGTLIVLVPDVGARLEF